MKRTMMVVVVLALSGCATVHDWSCPVSVDG